MKTVASIEDLKRIAKKKVPRPFFEYVENGSYEGLTLRANRSALDGIALRQRVMIDVSVTSANTVSCGHRSLMTTIAAWTSPRR